MSLGRFVRSDGWPHEYTHVIHDQLADLTKPELDQLQWRIETQSQLLLQYAIEGREGTVGGEEEKISAPLRHMYFNVKLILRAQL